MGVVIELKFHSFGFSELYFVNGCFQIVIFAKYGRYFLYFCDQGSCPPFIAISSPVRTKAYLKELSLVGQHIQRPLLVLLLAGQLSPPVKQLEYAMVRTKCCESQLL